MTKRKLLLIQEDCPGDIACFSAIARDIQLSYPDEFELHYHGNHSDMMRYSPHITQIWDNLPSNMSVFNGKYGMYLDLAFKVPLHFITAYHRRFEKLFHKALSPIYPHGDLHLPEHLYKERPVKHRYWVIITGGKTDYPVKIWSGEYWKQAAAALTARGLKFIQCGKTTGDDDGPHPKIPGALNFLDKTSVLELMWVIYHAEGVMCHVTGAMHIAAAFRKPCVVVGGAREEWWWEAYANVRGVPYFGDLAEPVAVPHQYLHTLYTLPCKSGWKDGAGCWKHKVYPHEIKRPCSFPVSDGHHQIIPYCMYLIRPTHVEKAVMSYYEEGFLPPIAIDPDKVSQFLAQYNELPNTSQMPPKRVREIKEALQRRQAEIGEPQFEITEKPTQRKNFQPAAPPPKIQKQAPPQKLQFALCFTGQSTVLQKTCLYNLLENVYTTSDNLTIICSGVHVDLVMYLHSLQDELNLTLLDVNIKEKSKLVHAVLNNSNFPQKGWMMWLSHKAIVQKHSTWRENLNLLITDALSETDKVIGVRQCHTMTTAEIASIRQKPWYRNRLFQSKKGIETPSGNKLMRTGTDFFIADIAALKHSQIPDDTIPNNQFETMFSAQLWQQGISIRNWNSMNKYVKVLK